MNDLLNTLIKALGQSCQLEDPKQRKQLTRDLGSLLTRHFKSKEVKKAVSKALDIAKGVPGAMQPEPKKAAEGGLVEWQRGKIQSQAKPSQTSTPGSVVEDNNGGLIDATANKGNDQVKDIEAASNGDDLPDPFPDGIIPKAQGQETGQAVINGPAPGTVPAAQVEGGAYHPETIQDLQNIANLANDEVINHFGGISKVKKFAKAQGFKTKHSLGGDSYLDAFRGEVIKLLDKIGGGENEEE